MSDTPNKALQATAAAPGSGAIYEIRLPPLHFWSQAQRLSLSLVVRPQSGLTRRYSNADRNTSLILS